MVVCRCLAYICDAASVHRQDGYIGFCIKTVVTSKIMNLSNEMFVSVVTVTYFSQVPGVLCLTFLCKELC